MRTEKTYKDIKKLIADNKIEIVDFKMIDISGAYRHVSMPASTVTEKVFKDGIGFDASNYGYAVVEKSDMVFIPDAQTAYIDPFAEIPTLCICGDAMVIGYPKNKPLAQYPRNVLKAAAEYLKNSGYADEMLILPEFEFYLFDNINWNISSDNISVDLDSDQAHWNSGVQGQGRVVQKQKAYHTDRPLDVSFDARNKMVSLLENLGIPIKYHHPEVGSAGQFEIEPMLGEVTKMADATMMIKYIIKNVAQNYGFTATFMPKPVYGEAGSGMHVHMMLLKNGKNVFSDDKGYSHLSKKAMHFIGGILKHISSLCAITNPSTNSFKRLIPGFEAPVTVGFATSNRSAVIRIPAYAKESQERRFELRNPDATCNAYYCYAAILMAGLDGLKNKIDPEENGWGPFDVNLYNLPEEEKAKLTGLPVCLEDALKALEQDNDYLTVDNVFPKELIESFIKNKKAECAKLSAIPHPAEFDSYYNC